MVAAELAVGEPAVVPEPTLVVTRVPVAARELAAALEETKALVSVVRRMPVVVPAPRRATLALLVPKMGELVEHRSWSITHH